MSWLGRKKGLLWKGNGTTGFLRTTMSTSGSSPTASGPVWPASTTATSISGGTRRTVSRLRSTSQNKQKPSEPWHEERPSLHQRRPLLLSVQQKSYLVKEEIAVASSSRTSKTV